jgi:hypothetical protein
LYTVARGKNLDVFGRRELLFFIDLLATEKFKSSFIPLHSYLINLAPFLSLLCFREYDFLPKTTGTGHLTKIFMETSKGSP